MSDQEKRKRDEDQQDDRRSLDWLNKLSDGLLWLNDRAWPLAGGVLFTATMYVFKYIQDEKVPLSITSPSVIAALPIVFALLSFMIAVTVIVFTAPTILLLTPVVKQGDHLVGELEKKSTVGKRGAAVRASFVFSWLAGMSALGLFLWVVVFMPEEWKATSPILSSASTPILLLLATAIFIAFALYGQIHRLSWKEVSTDFKAACVMGGILQLFVMFFLFSASWAIVRSSGSIGYLVLYVFLGGVMIGVIQLLSALAFSWLKKRKGSIAEGVVVSITGIMLFILLTPISGKLAGFALQVTASGGNSCVVMSWTPDAVASTKLLEDPAREQHSQELRVMAEIDGYYLVRPFESSTKEIKFVPRASVAGLEGCPPKRGS